jgi:hypothetical protein
MTIAISGHYLLDNLQSIQRDVACVIIEPVPQRSKRFGQGDDLALFDCTYGRQNVPTNEGHFTDGITELHPRRRHGYHDRGAPLG